MAQAIKYQPFERYEKLNTWAIAGYPEIQLMEGGVIPSHDDGIEAWQPMLVLRNDRAAWSFRGPGQKVKSLAPQGPGNLIVLDIAKKHLVSGRSQTPWLTICWNPGRSVPLMAGHTLEQVAERASKAFLEVLGEA